MYVHFITSISGQTYRLLLALEGHSACVHIITIISSYKQLICVSRAPLHLHQGQRHMLQSGGGGGGGGGGSSFCPASLVCSIQ